MSDPKSESRQTVDAVTYWTLCGAAAIITGPLAYSLLAGLQFSDGSSGAPAFASSLIGGGFRWVTAVVIASIPGLIACARLDASKAMSIAGVGIAWLAIFSPSTSVVLRARMGQTGSGPFVIESVAAAGVILILVGLLTLLGRTVPGHMPTNAPRKAVAVLGAAAAGAVAALVIAWLMTYHGVRGQSFFAAIVGSIACGAASVVVHASLLRDVINQPRSIRRAAIGVAIACVVSNGVMMFASGGAIHAASIGTLPGMTSINGLDWIAGSLLGLPIGVAWAGSLFERGTQTRPVGA